MAFVEEYKGGRGCEKYLREVEEVNRCIQVGRQKVFVIWVNVGCWMAVTFEVMEGKVVSGIVGLDVIKL